MRFFSLSHIKNLLYLNDYRRYIISSIRSDFRYCQL